MKPSGPRAHLTVGVPIFYPTRKRQYMNIGKSCPLPLCTLIRTFRIYCGQSSKQTLALNWAKKSTTNIICWLCFFSFLLPQFLASKWPKYMLCLPSKRGTSIGRMRPSPYLYIVSPVVILRKWVCDNCGSTSCQREKVAT